jgi:8-oxo-dGTP pyrophosphatase MutT (NUDIX family)
MAQLARAKPVAANIVAARAAEALRPQMNNITPIDIESALRAQGLDWAQPFAPGAPLTPFHGYNRRPRERDYQVGRNITTERRPGRIPFETLRHLISSYDVAQICYRHAIQDLRSMRIRYEVMDGYEENAVKEIAAAREFWKRPDRKIDPDTGKVIKGTGSTTRNWLCKHATDVWRFDCGSLYRHRDRAGRLISLPVPDGTLFAPMLDYFGTNPTGEAPAFQQFIQGIPWDWLRWEDLIYEPMWPNTTDPYGIAPIETILVNAETDMNLQNYFLQFFTTGTVPEAFAIAPEDQSDPDSLEEWQENYNDWTYGDLSERWGLRWLPHDTDLHFYKPQQFDPDVAEYVMRRTVASFMMVPHDLGFTADVNRSTGDTQMDTQFRINSLPHVAYYEDIMDSITQEDLGLPVQCRFDTGREKEDRLMEAQAHQIYVSMAAESPDEVRDKVLGYAVNPEEKVPRFFDSTRLGPIPISYLLATAGDIDPLTGAPRPGTVQRRDLVLPGTPGPDPIEEGADPAHPYDDAKQHDAARGKKVGGANPKGLGVSAPAPGPPLGQASVLPIGTKPVASNARRTPQPHGSASPRRSPDQGTASRRILKSVDEIADLGKWRAQSRKRVAGGRSPRPFMDSAISEETFAKVWKSLEGAATRADVDEAFAKADTVETRPFAGMALRAADTGRVLMVQRAHREDDPAGGYFEFPGGHVDEGENSMDGALREWEEETGCKMPDSAQPVGGWDSTNGVYSGHVWEIPSEGDVDLWDRTEVDDPDNPDQDYFEAIVWHDPAHLSNNPSIRPELRADSQVAQHAISSGVTAKSDDNEPETPKTAGLAMVCRSTSRVLMVQRGNKDDGDGARWEFPTGHLDEGETSLETAMREWTEETGSPFPDAADQIGSWTSEDKEFQGFVFSIKDEDEVTIGSADGHEISAISWWDIKDLDADEMRDKVGDSLDEVEPIIEQAEKAGGPPKAPRGPRP